MVVESNGLFLFLDVNSIHFLEPSELEQLKNFEVIHSYLEQKELELEEYNKPYSDEVTFKVVEWAEG